MRELTQMSITNFDNIHREKHMKNLAISFVVLVIGVATTLKVDANTLSNFIEKPQKVGEARLSVLFWDIYDAELVAPQGKYSEDAPFALSLKYLRDFEGDDIASRSVDEMRKLGMTDEIKLAKWYQKMQQLFPDVKEGQTITGVVDAQQVSHFFIDEQSLGQVNDKEFSQWFFNIWLSEKTSEPKMRAKLLGLS